MVATLSLAIALSLLVSPAMAATKKKKKSEAAKKEEKREERHERAMEHKEPIEGLNTSGKPGYFISDTAAVLEQGQIAGAAHFTFDSWGSALEIPVGMTLGLPIKLLPTLTPLFMLPVAQAASIT